MHYRSAARRALALALLPTALAACSSSTSIQPAAPKVAAGTASVRAVHASPDAGPVDIYVYAQGASIPSTPTVSNAAYGNITSYLSVPAGSYTVAVFAAGSPSSGTPVASESVTVAANVQYSIAVAGKAKSSPATLQFLNFVEPAETAGQSALIVHHASPYVGSAIQPVGVGIYDANVVGNGIPSSNLAPAASQTTQVFSFSFTAGTSGPAVSGNVSGGEFFVSPIPANLPTAVGFAAGAPGTNGAPLGSVAVHAVPSVLGSAFSSDTGETIPAGAHVSIFAVDSASGAALIGTLDP